MAAGFKPKGVFTPKESADPEKEPTVKKKPKRKYATWQKAEIARRFQDDFDAIYEAYTNPKKIDKMTITLRQQLMRWKFARQWISDFEPYNDFQVVKALRTEFHISERQAYTDVANCKRFFASVDKTNAEFDKIMYIEKLQRLRQKSMLLNNSKGFEVATRCDAILAKVMGYDREHIDLPQPIIVNVQTTTDLSVLGLKPVENLPALIKTFWKKKDEEKQREIEDIDYDELLDNPRNESELRK